VLDREEALERVVAILSEKATPNEPWVVVENQKLETASAWIFVYNSKRYLETGEIIYALAGNGPVFVNKKTGEVKFHGSIPPLQTIIDEYENTMNAG